MQSKDDAVKKAILESAKRVFQKWGLNKSTMEDIAHEAGKGKSTLYYYFKSKEEILETLMYHEFTTIQQRAQTTIEDERSGKMKLRKYIAATLVEIKKTVGFYPILAGELKGYKDLVDKLVTQIDRREEGIINEILDYGVTHGDFAFISPQERRKAANVILGIIRGLQLHLFLENDDSEKIDIATRLITDGL